MKAAPILSDGSTFWSEFLSQDCELCLLTDLDGTLFSVALHFRRVKSYERSALLIATAALAEHWLAEHSDYERLNGEQVFEIRPQSARKSSAVQWVRDEIGFKGKSDIHRD